MKEIINTKIDHPWIFLLIQFMYWLCLGIKIVCIVCLLQHLPTPLFIKLFCLISNNRKVWSLKYLPLTKPLETWTSGKDLDRGALPSKLTFHVSLKFRAQTGYYQEDLSSDELQTPGQPGISLSCDHTNAQSKMSLDLWK